MPKSRTEPLPKFAAVDIESAVAGYFGKRQNLIIPNVSWGFFNDGHEADVVVVRKSNRAEEIEIKVSRADIKRDLAKNRGRGHCRPLTMTRLWFAVPESLADDPNIPDYAGVLSVSQASTGRFCFANCYRAAPLNPGSRPLSNDEVLGLLRLSTFRVWSLKEALARRSRERDSNRGAYAELQQLRERWERAAYAPSWGCEGGA